MQNLLKEPVHVSAIFRGFREADNSTGESWEHKRITPRVIKRKKGEVLKIKETRRSWGQRKGKNIQVHFNIETEEERFFHLVYESEKMLWILLYEFDDQLMFDEKNVDIQLD